jgi:NADPH:quinone reductase-like Zn-dependent oxidoreductase
MVTFWPLSAACNPVDFKTRSGTMMAFVVARPKIPGGDLAGVIEKGVGKVCMAVPRQDHCFSNATFSNLWCACSSMSATGCLR